MTPRVAVIQFPGLERRPRRRLGARRRSAPTPRSSGTRTRSSPTGRPRSSCPAASRTATTSAAARSRASRRSWKRFERSRPDGGLVLGICNGFQILCEAGLLPGVLRPNASLSFVCRDVALRVERADTPFTSRCREGQRLVIPVKHREGAWFAPPELVAELEERGQILLRYEENPNGAVADVAARDERGRKRHGPDAASRARGRPAARLRRRRADPRVAARCGARACVSSRRARVASPDAALRPLRATA